MSTSCDGCAGDNSLIHTVNQLHNDVGDALGDIAALGYKEVVCILVVCDGNNISSALIADVELREICITQTKALLDMKVADTDATS